MTLQRSVTKTARTCGDVDAMRNSGGPKIRASGFVHSTHWRQSKNLPDGGTCVHQPSLRVVGHPLGGALCDEYPSVHSNAETWASPVMELRHQCLFNKQMPRDQYDSG